MFKPDTSLETELGKTANSCEYIEKLDLVLAKYESLGVDGKAGSATKFGSA